MSTGTLIRVVTLAALIVGAVGPLSAQLRPRQGPRPGGPPPGGPPPGPPPGDFAPLPPLLQRALRGGGPKRFSGERIVEFRRGPNRNRHREFIMRDGPRFRIDFPNDSEFAGQIIVDTGDRRFHYFPDANEIHETPSRRDEGNIRIRALPGRFGKGRVNFQEEQPQTVAGIRVVPFSARDGAGNVLVRVWIDPRSEMVLKREFYDQVGSSVGILEYVSIDFNPIIRPEDFRIKREGAQLVTAETLARRLMKRAGMLEVFLGKGHGLELEHARLLEGQGQPILLQVYKGPNGPVSFYQVQGEVNPERLRRQAGGEFRTTSWSANGRTFVIVGELTDEQLKALARSAQ